MKKETNAPDCENTADNEVVKGTFCPVCHKPALKKYLPFCSKRCKDIDLNRWFNGAYSVPMQEQDDEDVKELAAAVEDKE